MAFRQIATMEIKTSPMDPLAPVAEICARHHVKCSPAEFQAAVNVAFHRFESEHYDEFHQNMWESLPAQVNLLAEDCLRAGVPQPIRMLDIGCGTGLATDCVMRSPLADKIESIDLLDTSSAMLARAQARRSGWARPGEAIEGLVESLLNNDGTARKPYNLIITCSVLHHVPDLGSFLRAVTALQLGQPASFIHLQDPNGDFLKDPELQRRIASTAPKTPEWLARFAPQRVLGRLVREIKGEQGVDYISQTNQELIQKGLIDSPLSVADIFAITDIHAQEGEGISIQQIGSLLPAYTLLSSRAYGFFGKLASELPPSQRAVEEKLIQQRALNGFHIEALWRSRL